MCKHKKKIKNKKKRNSHRHRDSIVEIVYRLLEEVLPFLLSRWCGQRCLTAPHAVAVVTCREKESLELIVETIPGHYRASISVPLSLKENYVTYVFVNEKRSNCEYQEEPKDNSN